MRIEKPEGESELIRMARSGDRRAMEALLAKHESALHALCIATLGHPQDAEDAVQETFIRAVRSFSRFREESQLRTWLNRIAINICLDMIRRRRNVMPLDSALNLSSANSVESNALNRISINDALNQLSPRRRAVLVLREVEGWSAEEIATAMGWRSSRVYFEHRMSLQAIARWQEAEERKGEGR